MQQSQTPMAELVGVHKRYGKTVALDGLDLSVGRGQLLAVLGPNGAGKTTAISLLLGLARPDTGTARLFGRSPELVEVRRAVGVMLQEAALAPELRVREQVDLAASYYPSPLPTGDVLSMTRTTAIADRPYDKLSGGQKRQAQLAVALCGRPQLLFLDEPTVGLDVEAREAMWATLRRQVEAGTSIVLTTHYLEEAEALADRVVVMVKGTAIAAGTVEEIRSLVSRKRISCSTALGLDEIRSWTGVEAVHRDLQKLQITARDAESVVRRLLASDLALADLEVHRAGLAEAFVSLTRTQGVDDMSTGVEAS